MTHFRHAAALAAGATLVASPLGVSAQQLSSPFAATTLSASAFGEVKFPPDMATITLGVETSAPTAEAAARANAERMAGVLAALKGAAIPPRDVQTARLSLAPQYAYESNQPPRLTGYEASNQVTVRISDLSTLGRVVDSVVSGGATNIGEIAFGLANPVAAENSARLAAIKALEDKAALYAQATGFRASRLVNLAEGGELQGGPPMPMALAARRPQAATSVNPGEVVVRVEVSGLFELTR